ncbi:MAG: response regulator [Gemmataceae bacterium]
MALIKILIADDHTLFRAGLRKLIEGEANMEVIDEVDNGTDVLIRTPNCSPDVVCLDLHMPGTGSLKVIEQLRTEMPKVAVLVLTMQEEPAYIQAALAAGCQGYVLKTAPASEFIEAIRTLAAGQTYVNEQLRDTTKSSSASSRRPSQEAPEPKKLSPRESEILALLAQGYSYKEISEKLHVSTKTVETYRTRLGKKLGLQTRAALVKYYQEVWQPNSDDQS